MSSSNLLLSGSIVELHLRYVVTLYPETNKTHAINGQYILLSDCIRSAWQNIERTGLKKLNVFIGTWKAQNKPGAGDSSVSVYSCEWSLYGRFLVCDQLVNLPEGQTNNLSVYSYDSISQQYSLSLVGVAHMDPFSMPVVARGDTLIYSGSYVNEGVKM